VNDVTLLTKTQKPNGNVRVTLDLSAQFHSRLTKLECLLDAKTKADVIRQALQLYEYVVKKAAAGYTFRQVSPDGKEENIVFFQLPDSTNE